MILSIFIILPPILSGHKQRWGDAPVHSIGAALFLPKSRIHFWDEIGYEHNPYTHCPRMGNNWQEGKCSCDPQRSFGEFLNPICRESYTNN